MSSIGHVIARDLGDGHVEWWESRPDGVTPIHPDAETARDELARAGADPDTWRVYALVDTQEAT